MTMGKENITRITSSTEKHSLRCFRIRKDISYTELSSESENESKKNFSPEDDSLCRDKKLQNKLSKVSHPDKNLSNVSNHNISSKSLNDLHHIPKEPESLSSDEITLYLSELNSSSDSIQEKCREHLHSIENVASLSESKLNDGKTSPTPLKLNRNVLRSSSEFNYTEPYENISNKISLISDNNQLSQGQNQKKDTFPFKSDSLKMKPEFLDTYKTHLSNKHLNSENKSKRGPSLFKDSVMSEKSSDKYSLCNQQLFKCNVCNYCCSDLLLHKSHLILFHSKNKILDCEYCDYQTSQCANLATHIRVHFQQDRDFKCPVKKSVKSHLVASHRRKTSYECTKCDFVCKSQIKFKKHSQTHLNLGKYECSDCNLHFKNKETLKTHVKKHLTQEKSFQCLSCHLSFCKKQQLKIHLRSHEQSYVCDICNFKCTYKHKLEIHMKIHTRKSLKCEKCSSIFSKKSNLKLHMRVHFPNKKCQHCPFQSTDSNELSKHICIKKLYNVQKRSLNFGNGNNVHGEFEQINTEKNEVMSSLKSTVVQCTKRVKEPIEETNNKLGLTKSAPPRKKQKQNKRRLLSLRSHVHVPSLINKKSGNDKKEELVKELRYVDKPNNTLRRNKFSDKRITRNSLKQSSWVIDEVVVSANEKNELRKTIKHDRQQSLGLNCTATLFNNKLTPKEILLEPVRLTNGSYIQCYYQSQPSINIPNHLESHIRQSTLLSCRLCNYKTNSSRLLQCHTAKKHTWDPAVVSMLFS